MTTPADRHSISPASRRSSVAGSSALTGTPGVPWWAAVLTAVVLTAVGAVIGGSDFTDGAPGSLWVCFLGGCVIAALVVRRRSIFTAMVQPPIVGAAVVLVMGLVDGQRAVFAAVNVVKSFPLLAVGTGLAVLIGLARIAAQPLRARSAKRLDAPEPAVGSPA